MSVGACTCRFCHRVDRIHLRNQSFRSLEYSPATELNHHTLPDEPEEVMDPH